MKKIKNINLLLIILLLILLVYNCFNKKTIENVENSCPTKEQVKTLQEKNDALSKKLDAHQEKINEQNNTIQEAKMQKVKDFCDSAKQQFEDLNNKVNSIIDNFKKNNNK